MYTMKILGHRFVFIQDFFLFVFVFVCVCGVGGGVGGYNCFLA